MIDLPRERHSNYDRYTPNMIRRLDGFYGRVDSRMNERIEHWALGGKVLDIGCGFGQLVEHLRIKGFQVTGIDMLNDFIEAGKQKYPLADLRCAPFNRFIFSENDFETVILKDTIHHIIEESDIDEFWINIRRICRRRVIIMDPNPTLFLRLARRLIKHVDPICTPNQAKQSLKNAGFSLVYQGYNEVLAFPLSGGFVGPPLVHKRLGFLVLNLDQMFEKLLEQLSLSDIFCWRYLIVADAV